MRGESVGVAGACLSSVLLAVCAPACPWRRAAPTGPLPTPPSRRFAIAGDVLYVSDTSSVRSATSHEEVNGPVLVKRARNASIANFGYPCYTGSAPNPAYQGLSSPLCDINNTLPFYSYSPATMNTSSASISALAVAGGRMFIGEWGTGRVRASAPIASRPHMPPCPTQHPLPGDYTLGRLWSVSLTDTSDVRHHIASGAAPVDIEATGLGDLVYVNVGFGPGMGSVMSVPGTAPAASGADSSTLGIARALAAAALALLLVHG